MIAGIINSYIALFKDASLVLIIGLFDLLGSSSLISDPDSATAEDRGTGYVFAAVLYCVFYFGMSRYSQLVERRLRVGLQAKTYPVGEGSSPLAGGRRKRGTQPVDEP